MCCMYLGLAPYSTMTSVSSDNDFWEMMTMLLVEYGFNSEYKSYHILSYPTEAILRFWDHFKDTDFFKQHPVLSDPATCQQVKA